MKRRTLLILVVILSLLMIPVPARALTLTVNSTADNADANPSDSVCETFTPGECTLRAAIMEANTSPGADMISFNIPGSGPYTISPSYGFDFISDPVTIDATTQPGFSGTPIIELDGSGAGAGVTGLHIVAGFSTIKGLVINRFDATGIDLDSSSNSVVQGNFIGTDVSGTVALGNSGNGITIDTGATHDLIGGTTPETRNLISANGYANVEIGNPGTTDNIVEGNYIGTDVAGTVQLGNSTNGVTIDNGASNNTIGGTVLGAGNLISGNVFGVGMGGSGSDGNVVQGNLIGTDVSGTRPIGNWVGAIIGGGSSDNVIGGTAAGAGNVISGNGDFGVQIGYDGTSGNRVQGNFIGTDVNGIVGIANASGGIGIFGPTSDNLIGGTTAAARNIISGNGGAGVNICCDGSTRNLVKGNFIGTDVSGTLSLGNAGDGVSIYQSADNTIGGIEAGARNLISGNQSNGVGIYDVGTTGNLVQGNYIGTDVTGMIDVGNSWDGVVICCGGASGNTVGGTALEAGNLISGNDGSGIGIYDTTTANMVQGNLIGTDATGTGSLGNGANGIGIAGGPTNNTIGGTTNGARNTIAFNGANGVSLTADAGTGNVISSNSIYSNGSLGIDLGENGVTLNDLFDADGGPNNLQNFPMLTSVKSKDKGVEVRGTLLSTPNTIFRLEFFRNNICDSSGYGEGETYLGFAEVKTKLTGLATFKILLSAPLMGGNLMTVTATDPAGNTSEFSPCMMVK
jgi:CSLREA domain-containing protein